MHNVSEIHQNEVGIGKSIPDAQEISRDPRDFPRAKPEGSQADVGWLSVNVAKSLRAFVESVFANSRVKTLFLQFRENRQFIVVNLLVLTQDTIAVYLVWQCCGGATILCSTGSYTGTAGAKEEQVKKRGIYFLF